MAMVPYRGRAAPKTQAAMFRKVGAALRREAALGASARALVVPGLTRTGGYYGSAKRAREFPTQELKFHDLDVDNATFAAAGEIGSSMNLIAQGTGESERIGRKITIKSIDWRGRLLYPESTAQDSVTVRLMVVLDKQANGAQPGVTDILESADYNSFNNLANKGRFQTLMDKTHTLQRVAGPEVAASAYPEASVPFQWHKTCSIPVEFSSTTGVIAEVRSNNIVTLQITSDNVGSLDSKVRVRFVG